jgi:hypothetical protein
MLALRAASSSLFAIAVLSHALFARADDADAARAEARSFASKGDEAFAAGRCDRAVPQWKQAESKFHAPTLLFRIARCQLLLGHVVDAAATLDAIASEKLASDAPDAWKDAQREAKTELPAVRARIATIEIVVDARGTGATPSIMIDDLGMPSGRSAFPVDPGSHAVRVTAKDARWEQHVQVTDGEKRTLRVSLGLEQRAAPVPTQRIVGYVLGGAGMLSMAVGGVFGAKAYGDSHDLDSICGVNRRDQCPDYAKPTMDRLKTEALVADLALGGGAALFAAGVVVVLTAPAPKREEPRLYFAPMGAGAVVGGRF